MRSLQMKIRLNAFMLCFLISALGVAAIDGSAFAGHSMQGGGGRAPRRPWAVSRRGSAALGLPSGRGGSSSGGGNPGALHDSRGAAQVGSEDPRSDVPFGRKRSYAAGNSREAGLSSGGGEPMVGGGAQGDTRDPSSSGGGGNVRPSAGAGRRTGAGVLSEVSVPNSGQTRGAPAQGEKRSGAPSSTESAQPGAPLGL